MGSIFLKPVAVVLKSGRISSVRIKFFTFLLNKNDMKTLFKALNGLDLNLLPKVHSELLL